MSTVLVRFPLTLDLFESLELAPGSLARQYREAFSGWLAEARRSGYLRSSGSIRVYEAIWQALSSWLIGQGVELQRASPADLQAYLRSRGGSEDLSPRHEQRILRLFDRVAESWAGQGGITANLAGRSLIEATPEIRYANAADKDPLPPYLSASEAKRLVTYLSMVRPKAGGSPAHTWQEVRNRAAAGLMLGAGLTPVELRSLQLAHVIAAGGRRQGVPWKLHVEGTAGSPARETPIAPWAGQLLAYWLQVRAEQAIPGEWVFPSTKSTGKPWSKVGQYESMREVLQAAGIDEVEGGSFRLRHTFALRQLKRGTEPSQVASWLGVSDPGVMARYQRVLLGPMDVV